MAEWSKAPDSSSGPRERAWVQIPLLTFYVILITLVSFARIDWILTFLIQCFH
uniref:Uncharacterized protein n=1 Tax=Cajanus cajan TaxID=3821 RepID=A0A151UAJ3_CAJCA|nr:hypothetical protein KK1_020491 [Cajanus cajan]